MLRVPVVSSNLRSVGYDPATHVLEVGFHGGRIYQYDGVPEHVHRGLMSAGSIGGDLADHVKDVSPYRRVG